MTFASLTARVFCEQDTRVTPISRSGSDTSSTASEAGEEEEPSPEEEEEEGKKAAT